MPADSNAYSQILHFYDINCNKNATFTHPPEFRVDFLLGVGPINEGPRPYLPSHYFHDIRIIE